MRKTASNAHIWINCAGYTKQANAFVKRFGRIKNPATEDGIMAHEIGEHLIRLMSVSGTSGQDVPEVWKKRVVPKDMRIKVFDYAHLCFSWMRRARIFGGPGLWIERDVRTTFLDADLITRVDFALYDPATKRLIVTDLKYGYRTVEAIGNPQLIIAARAICDELAKSDDEVKKISLNIYQPNGQTTNSPLDQHTIDIEHLYTQSNVIAKRFAYDGDELQPGGHCRGCEARGGCSALRRANYEAWDVMGLYSDVPDSFPAETLENMLAELEVMKDMLRGYETGLQAMVVNRIKNGDEFPLWEYSHSLSNKKWIYPAEDIIEMGKCFDVNLEEKTVMSPRQAELAGIPKDVISTFVKRDKTAPKLRKKIKRKQ
jgi:hypothetical protein